MRILHLINEGLTGGVLRVAIEQAIHLNSLGHTNIVVAGFPTHIFEGFSSGKIYYKLNLRLSSLLTPVLGPLLKTLTANLFEPSIPEKFIPDWIICHNLGLIYDALMLKKKWDTKLAVMVHNPVLPPVLPDFIVRLFRLERSLVNKVPLMLGNCDLVISTSRKTRKLVSKLYGVDSEILYPGCNPLPKIPKTRGSFILCASRLSLGKRIHVIAQAVSIANKKVKVIFAGSTHVTTPRVIRKIGETGLRNYEVVPNIPETTLSKLYATCRMYISANAEPFGMHQIESASHGAPMVCNTHSGASELFVHKIHGYFCEDSNGHAPIDQYAMYIEELLSNESKARSLGCAAWNLCRERYTWKHHVKRLICMLESSENFRPNESSDN